MDEKPRNLRISRLIEEDFMRIRALDIQPGNTSLVILKGNNEEGKTSALRAIRSALCGKRADPPTPIRQGAENGSVKLILADDVADRLNVTVSWTPNGRYLTVKQLDEELFGRKVSAGQTLLDALVGALTYDPLEFMRQTPAAQVELLMTAIGQADEYAALMAKRKTFYEKRAEANARAKDLAGKIGANPDPSPAETLERISDDDLQAEFAEAEAQNKKIEAYRHKLQDHQVHTRALRFQVEQDRARLEALLDEVKVHQERIASKDREIEDREQKEAQSYAKLAKQEPLSTLDIATKVESVAVHNRKVDQQEQARKLLARKKEVEQAARDHEAAMRGVDTAIAKILSSSNIGRYVDGLAIDADGNITHHGIDIRQASGKQQLQLSCLIGMACNPAIRVMCIDEGDRLDPEALEALKAIAAENDYQVWMTAVYSGNGHGNEHVVRIVDGASADAPPVDANEGVEDIYA